MRKRTLHPDFFTDPKVLKLAPLERLFFQGLWCTADKAGVLVDDPEALAIRILPRDPTFDPEAAMVRMASLGLLIRYVSGFRMLAWICNFSRYQRPHPNEAASGLPLPTAPRKPKPSDSDEGLPMEHQGSPKVANVSRISGPSVSQDLHSSTTGASAEKLGARILEESPETERPASPAAQEPAGREDLETPQPQPKTVPAATRPPLTLVPEPGQLSARDLVIVKLGDQREAAKLSREDADRYGPELDEWLARMGEEKFLRAYQRYLGTPKFYWEKKKRTIHLAAEQWPWDLFKRNAAKYLEPPEAEAPLEACCEEPGCEYPQRRELGGRHLCEKHFYSQWRPLSSGLQFGRPAEHAR